MHCDLSTFDLAETLRTGREIRSLSSEAATLETAAQQMCHALHAGLRADDGAPACVLVRCYKTHPFGELPAPLQQFARGSALAAGVGPETRCLVLLGSAGDEPGWNS